MVVRYSCRDAGKFSFYLCLTRRLFGRIVEYATREQAQNAVATLSNQNLMGRLVYVREVRLLSYCHFLSLMTSGPRS